MSFICLLNVHSPSACLDFVRCKWSISISSSRVFTLPPLFLHGWEAWDSTKCQSIQMEHKCMNIQSALMWNLRFQSLFQGLCVNRLSGTRATVNMMMMMMMFYRCNKLMWLVFFFFYTVLVVFLFWLKYTRITLHFHVTSTYFLSEKGVKYPASIVTICNLFEMDTLSNSLDKLLRFGYL